MSDAGGARRPIVGAGGAVGALAIPALSALLVAAYLWNPGRELPETQGQELPEGVTPAMVDSGARLFAGKGPCDTCHGEDASGVEELGSDLRDGEWSHVDGSYASLLEVIDDGLTAQESSTGIPMPPRGGAELTDQEIRALAAYVWSISRDGS